VMLDGSRLGLYANWITPAALPVRFDARFFVSPVSAAVIADVDGVELIDATWITPAAGHERATSGSWVAAFPTIKALEFLAGFDSVPSVLAHVATLGEVRSVQPRLVVEAGAVRILLPGDAGFEAAGTAKAERDLRMEMERISRRGGVVPAELRRP
jgi:hypothetical protein